MDSYFSGCQEKSQTDKDELVEVMKMLKHHKTEILAPTEYLMESNAEPQVPRLNETCPICDVLNPVTQKATENRCQKEENKRVREYTEAIPS